MANARNIKIPDGNGGLVTYPVEDTTSKRTRRNITNDLANLSAAVAEQNLEKYGYAIGDYFNGPSGYTYTLADRDPFYGGYSEYSVVNVHHIGIVVDCNQSVQWNKSDSTTTGYVGSNLHSYLTGTALPNVRSDFTSLFGSYANHLLSHRKIYTTNTDAWSWSEDQFISALTSVQLHGSPICDMNWHQTGEGNKPLEVFQKFFYPEILGNQNNWLRSVASASAPCYSDGSAAAGGNRGASESRGAVGLILFY